MKGEILLVETLAGVTGHFRTASLVVDIGGHRDSTLTAEQSLSPRSFTPDEQEPVHTAQRDRPQPRVSLKQSNTSSGCEGRVFLAAWHPFTAPPVGSVLVFFDSSLPLCVVGGGGGSGLESRGDWWPLEPLRAPSSLDSRPWIRSGTWLIPAAGKAGSFHCPAILARGTRQ